jgi:hypothetical protein
MEKDACLQSLCYISFRVPSKGALPPGSLHLHTLFRYTWVDFTRTGTKILVHMVVNVSKIN